MSTSLWTHWCEWLLHNCKELTRHRHTLSLKQSFPFFSLQHRLFSVSLVEMSTITWSTTRGRSILRAFLLCSSSVCVSGPFFFFKQKWDGQSFPTKPCCLVPGSRCLLKSSLSKALSFRLRPKRVPWILAPSPSLPGTTDDESWKVLPP